MKMYKQYSNHDRGDDSSPSRYAKGYTPKLIALSIDSDYVGACIAVVIYNLNLSSSIYVISIADLFLSVNTYFHLLLYYMFIYHLRSKNPSNAFKTYVLIITDF
jgi:hypothetical protein